MQALAAQLLIDYIRNYNSTVELLDYLPYASSQSYEERESSKRINNFPQMLKCSWTHGTPLLGEIPWPVPSSKSSHLPNEMDIRGTNDPYPNRSLSNSLRPQAINATKDNNSNKPAIDKSNNDKGGTAALGSTSVLPRLAVVEDRGVAISRDELMAELRQGAVAMANEEERNNPLRNPTVAVVPMIIDQPPPAYSREDAGLGGASAAAGATLLGGALNTKLKPPKPKKGPRIKILDDKESIKVFDKGGKSSNKTSAQQRSQQAATAKDISIITESAEHAVLKQASTSAALPVLPARNKSNTAFISVESLQKKKEPPATQGKKGDFTPMTIASGTGSGATIGTALAKKGSGIGTNNNIASALDTSSNAAGDAPKSWEDWLNPIGGASNRGTNASASEGQRGKKKKRRR